MQAAEGAKQGQVALNRLVNGKTGRDKSRQRVGVVGFLHRPEERGVALQPVAPEGSFAGERVIARRVYFFFGLSSGLTPWIAFVRLPHKLAPWG